MMNDLVSISVPRPYIALVRGFLAGLSAQGTLDGAEVSQPVQRGEAPSEAAEDWTSAMLDRLVRESHSGNMRAILKCLAEHPDEWVSTHALAEAIGDDADSNTVAGALGAFGRRCYNRYEMNSLPFEGRWDHEHGCKMHHMSGTIAGEILRAFEKLDT